MTKAIMFRTGVVMAIGIALVGTTGVRAQTGGAPPPATSSEPAKAVTPLKVTVVISRFQGEKKTGSLLYALLVNANAGPIHGGRTSLRMDEDVPIPSMTLKSGQGTVPSFSYRTVGTNIDCSAETMDDSRFELSLAVQDSSVFTEPSGAAAMKPLPSIESFNWTGGVILKDGQTIQSTIAIDKVTGEVIKVDVTLNVVK